MSAPGAGVVGRAMAQGRELSIEQIEAIRAAYFAAGGVVKAVARQLGVSEASVRKYGPAPDDDFATLRAEKRASVIEKLAAAQHAYLDHLMRPATVKGAAAKDAAVVFGILTDKRQLLTGEATERRETAAIDRFTDDQIARLAQVAAEVRSGERAP